MIVGIGSGTYAEFALFLARRHAGVTLLDVNDAVAAATANAHVVLLFATDAQVRAARAKGARVFGVTRPRDRVEEARVMAEAGLRVPRMKRVIGGQGAPPFPFPFLARTTDLVHEPFVFVTTAAAWASVPAIPLAAIEYVETAVDGVRDKYRCYCVGEHALPHHMMTSTNTIVRRDTQRAGPLAKEMAYLAGDTVPFADRFVRARKLLGVDLCDFDYGMIDDEPIVWETNLPPALDNRSLLQEQDALQRIYRVLEEELLS